MYYVVVIRRNGETDFVSLMDKSSAQARGWIDSKGNRIWAVPPDMEGGSRSFVFGFDNLDKAFIFASTFANNELGIKTEIGI